MIRKPNVFIIGAQKAASTFIQESLNRHHQIYIKPGEDPFFEDPDYNEEKIKEFEASFKTMPANIKYLGVKRPKYLSAKEVPGRIHLYYPDCKIIVILRNPIDRAISAYFHYIRDGFIPVRDVEVGMRSIIKGIYKSTYPRSSEIIDFGLYFEGLKNYFEYFKKEQIHIIIFDDIKKDPVGVIDKLYKFLNLKDKFEIHENFKTSKSKPQEAVYLIKRLRFLVKKNKYIYEYNENMTRCYVKKQNVFEKIIYNLILIIDHFILRIFFGNKKPVISDRLKGELCKIYEEDVRKLSDLLSIDLNYWVNKV